jgi:hypothetical protein
VDRRCPPTNDVARKHAAGGVAPQVRREQRASRAIRRPERENQ